MGEPLDLSAEAITVERLDRADNPRVKLAATVLQQSSVRDLVGEGVLERVLEIRIGSLRASSGSRSASNSIEPLRSAKRTVTCLRSPSSAPFDVRILSARCFGM